MKNLFDKDIMRLKCSLTGHIVIDFESMGLAPLVNTGVRRVDSSAAATPNMMLATKRCDLVGLRMTRCNSVLSGLVGEPEAATKDFDGTSAILYSHGPKVGVQSSIASLLRTSETV